jgi:hypothetical protein
MALVVERGEEKKRTRKAVEQISIFSLTKEAAT